MNHDDVLLVIKALDALGWVILESSLIVWGGLLMLALAGGKR